MSLSIIITNTTVFFYILTIIYFAFHLQSVLNGLQQKNHVINSTDPFSMVQAVVRQDDQICAASDDRKGGKPAGY